MLPVAAAKLTVGAGPSSLVRVRAWAPGLPTLVPVLGLARASTTVSSASGWVSPFTVTVTVWLVEPAGNVTVVGEANVKSLPLVAVELAASRLTRTVVAVVAAGVRRSVVV